MYKIKVPKGVHKGFEPGPGLEHIYEPMSSETMSKNPIKIEDWEVKLEKQVKTDSDYLSLKEALQAVLDKKPYRGQEDKERWELIAKINSRYDILKAHCKNGISDNRGRRSRKVPA